MSHGYQALATDYDGTLAQAGTVDDATLAALDRLAASGRKLILVTGREMSDLRGVFPQLARFDRVVAENGGVLYTPPTGQSRPLAPRPPVAFAAALLHRGVKPLVVGEVVVATRRPHEIEMAEVIAELDLPLSIILNKDAVMALPKGIDKGTGLAAALAELAVDPAETIGLGDAENDEPLLARCGCGVAVANALPELKAVARLVTVGARGAGVVEVIDSLLAGTLAARLS